MRRLFFAATLLVSASPLAAAEPCVTLDNKAVAALFDDWNFALSSLDANQVTQRYWPNAVLLPTASNAPSTSPAMISDYFKRFLVQRPRGHIDSRTIQAGCNLAVDMGTYTFSLMDDKGTTSNESARYTFVYQYRDGAWKILHQHSSAMPEALQGAMPDVNAAKASAAEVASPAKPAKSESLEPLSRRERRAMLKEAAKPARAAAKPVDKPATVAEAKPAADAKVAAGVKSPADAKSVADAKTATVEKTLAARSPESATSPLAKPGEYAKVPPEVRTNMFANLTSSPSPAKFYPPEALRHKERGNVNLKVCADGQGAVSDSMEVMKSSGSKLLDEAAMSWARAVTWVPATYNSHRVEGCAKVDVWFEPPPELASARN
jgi:uncharacterized protein (TIGR02246 family)